MFPGSPVTLRRNPVLSKYALVPLVTLLAVPALAATTVPVGHFDAVSLSGGGHVTIRHGASQSVRLLSGSTEFTTIKIKHGNDLDIEACNNRCPQHYDLEIEIVTPDLKAAAIEGGGHVTAEGGFPNSGEISAAVDGGGHLDLAALKADKVSAAVNGGGHIEVTALRDLSAAVDGGGSIVYHGDPQVSQAIDGGGSVSRAMK
jgi:Putative auto-transporter adhesin, head GIN domain